LAQQHKHGRQTHAHGRQLAPTHFQQHSLINGRTGSLFLAVFTRKYAAIRINGSEIPSMIARANPTLETSEHPSLVPAGPPAVDPTSPPQKVSAA